MKTILMPWLVLTIWFIAAPLSFANELTGPKPVKSKNRADLHRFYTESKMHPVAPAGGWGQRENVDQKKIVRPPRSKDPLTIWMESLEKHILSNWEPVSEEKFRVHMKVIRNGTFNEITICKSAGEKPAEQAALEAVQYSSGFMPLPVLPQADVQYTFNRALVKDKSAKFWQCRKELIETYPGLGEDFVLVHLIPSEVLNVVPGVQAKKVHCLKNLRLLNPGVNPKKLVSFRRRWVEFLRAEPKPSWSDVKRMARELESDYSQILSLPADFPQGN